MRLGGLRGPLVGLLVCSLFLFAGCGGPPTDGQVASDAGKDPVLMEAMGNYMNNRNKGKGGKKTSKSAKQSRAAPKDEASG